MPLVFCFGSKNANLITPVAICNEKERKNKYQNINKRININMNNEKHQVKESMYCIVMCLIEKAVKAKMNDTINVLSYGYAYIEIKSCR